MMGADKTLARMRANPRDWRIEDLKTVAPAQGELAAARNKSRHFPRA